MILDVGPRTIETFWPRCAQPKTLVWNGPFGAFETPPFDRGTIAAAKAVAELTRPASCFPLPAAAIRWQRSTHAGVDGRFHLRFDRGRRVPGMARGQGAAGRRGSQVSRLPLRPQFGMTSRLLIRTSRNDDELTELDKIAEAMVAPGKGILAADESTGTIKKRFDAIGVESTPNSRRDYRELLFRTTEAMTKHISGVILYDETIRQKAKDGTPLVKIIEKAGVSAGHQGRHRHQAAALLPGRDHHRGPRRPARAARSSIASSARASPSGAR